MSALESYRAWVQQKNQIVGSLLEEISLSVDGALEMEEVFTKEEQKAFRDFDDFLFTVRQSYPSTKTQKAPTSSSLTQVTGGTVENLGGNQGKTDGRKERTPEYL